MTTKHEILVAPECPNCGGTTWRYWEGGNYQKDFDIEFGYENLVLVQQDHNTDRESSCYYCGTCEAGSSFTMLELTDEQNARLDEIQQWFLNHEWDAERIDG